MADVIGKFAQPPRTIEWTASIPLLPVFLKWDRPRLCIAKLNKDVDIVSKEDDLMVVQSEDIFDVLMDRVIDANVADLDPEEPSNSTTSHDDISEAFSLMLTDDHCSHDDNCRFESIASDIDISGPSIPKAGEARHILKRLQPYREKPSKDRRKRFCAGKLYGDEGIPADHDVSIHQFWALNPQNAKISRAKCFLVGQIVSMFHLGVLCNSEKKCNKNLQIAMDLFTYLPESSKYIRNGRSGLLKASSLLLVNITENIKIIEDDVVFNYEDISELAEYLPYHA